MSFHASRKPGEPWRHFDLDLEGGIATLTFTRPERLNALTFEVYADLRDLMAELPKWDREARVLILRGEGTSFCSGGDVHEIIGQLLKMDGKDQLAFTRMTGAVIEGMRNLPIPILASIQGVAAGAGAVLALAADFRLMTADAKIAPLFVKVGLSGADMGAAYLLPRLVGLSKATEILMLGDTIDAETADSLGLVYEVLPEKAALERAVTALARRLASGPTEALAATKRMLTRELDMDLASSIEMDATIQAHLMRGRDFEVFHSAFCAKRKAEWTGR